MEDSIFTACPVCCADLRAGEIPKEQLHLYGKADSTTPQYFSKLVGYEITHVYDGTLYYECPVCESRFHRFRPGTDLWQRADPYVRRLDPPPVRIPDHLPKEEVLLSDDTLLVNVHSPGTCAGDYCSIHNPSNHALSHRPRKFHNGIILRVCKHGVDHPDPDALAWVGRVLDDGFVDTYAAHECCVEVCCR